MNLINRSLSMPSISKNPAGSNTQQIYRHRASEPGSDLSGIREDNKCQAETGGEVLSFTLELSGVNFNDITEETLKKGKLWQKFLQKQTKRNSDLDKKFAKEKQMLLKRQQDQMERRRKDNQLQRTAKVKSLSAQRDNASWSTEDEYNNLIGDIDRVLAAAVEKLVQYHTYETMRIDKVHKREKFDHDRKELKDGHEFFKKVKKEAHEVQLSAYETYQSNEVMEFTRTLQSRQVELLAKLGTEIKDKRELPEKTLELQVKLDKESLIRRKQLANAQEIRREQLIAEHKEQMKIVDQNYLKRIKEYEVCAQSEIDQLDRQIQELEDLQLVQQQNQDADHSDDHADDKKSG